MHTSHFAPFLPVTQHPRSYCADKRKVRVARPIRVREQEPADAVLRCGTEGPVSAGARAVGLQECSRGAPKQVGALGDDAPVPVFIPEEAQKPRSPTPNKETLAPASCSNLHI